jgi:hypothetical protein
MVELEYGTGSTRALRLEGTKRCILSPERLSPFALALSGKERGYP